MADTDIPDVGDTDLTRDELEEVADDLGIDPEGMDDQQLLERLGVELGELDADETRPADPDDEKDGDDGDREAGPSPRTSGSETSRRLRAKVADRLRGAADRVLPDSEAGSEEPEDPDEADGPAEDEDGPDETQPLPGEPIEGPTRDDLRERARDLGLSVTGTKDELQERIDEAEAEHDEGDRDEGDGEEQPLPGEPIEGPTRDELRDRLRELGLPVSGTKDELQARLEEAAPSDQTDGEVGGVRGLVAEKLDEAADRLRSSSGKQARRKQLKARRRELIKARRGDRIDAAKSFVRQLRRG